MLYEWLRVIKGTDLSLANQDDSALVDLNISNLNYIYVAQYYPFNNLFFWIDTPNDVAANIEIQYWANNQWVNAVDVLDGTKVNGVPFAKSGSIQFSPQRRISSWNQVTDTSETNNSSPSELSAYSIYDCYWIRIKATTALLSTAKAKRITYAFTNTQQLNKLDIEINQYYSAFASGKTDWIKEIITGSEIMLADLKSKGLVVHRGQILRFDDVSLACDMKVLALIYSNLGRAYEEKRKLKEEEYEKVINSRKFTFDNNNDGLVSSNEIGATAARMVR
jgi:hypothetical protein